MLKITRLCAALVLVACAAPATAQTEKAAARSFNSGGLSAVINRATPPNKQGQIAVSIVITNVRDDLAEIVIANRAAPTQVVTDGGAAITRFSFSGLAWCDRREFEKCVEDVDNQKLQPTALDGKQSLLVTISFLGSDNLKTCSIDLSMPVFTRQVAGKKFGSWRQTTISVPNITVC